MWQGHAQESPDNSFFWGGGAGKGARLTGPLISPQLKAPHISSEAVSGLNTKQTIGASQRTDSKNGICKFQRARGSVPVGRWGPHQWSRFWYLGGGSGLGLYLTPFSLSKWQGSVLRTPCVVAETLPPPPPP